MTHTHYLDKHLQQSFLSENRIDPITGEKIEAGHSVVICAACKSAFFVESWGYLGGSHCQQNETLAELPKQKNYIIRHKQDEFLSFGFHRGNYTLNTSIPRAVLDFAITIGVLGFASGLFFGLGFLLEHVNNMWVNFLLLIVTLALIFLGIRFYISQSEYTKKGVVYLIEKKQPKYLLGISWKNKSILLQKNNKPRNVRFEAIEEVEYALSVHPDPELHSSGYYLLIIRIYRKNKNTIKRYANIQEHQLENWSSFLEQLPNDLKVINRLAIEPQF